MLFDHDPEIGAILLLNLERNKIEGFLYRKDEIKETQEATRDDAKTGKPVNVKEEVTVQTDWYVMDCQGNWFNIKESTNPFIFYLPYFIESGMADDKAKLTYPILKDWILNLYMGEPTVSCGYTTYIAHEEPKDIPEDDTAARTAYYAKYKINTELLNRSAEWIQLSLDPTPDTAELTDPKFDGHKKLLKKLDEFEYDIGDKK